MYAHTHTHTQAVSTEYSGQTYTVSQEPLTLTLPPITTSHLTLTVSFQGHYREPPLQLQCAVAPGNQVYRLHYHIREGQWRVEKV